MYSNAKNITNYLVESETLPMFVLPNVAIRNIIRYIQSLFKAEFLLQYLTCCDIARLATKRGSALFLHTLTNFCLTKCQTWTKALKQRTIVTATHFHLLKFASIVNYSAISVPYRQCARLTNRNYPTKPTKCRYARLLRRRLTGLKKTLNLQTYTRLRTRYTHSAGLWRILTPVFSTYQSILNQLESLFDREPLLMPI